MGLRSEGPIQHRDDFAIAVDAAFVQLRVILQIRFGEGFEGDVG
jgi:hypothetical protein